MVRNQALGRVEKYFLSLQSSKPKNSRILTYSPQIFLFVFFTWVTGKYINHVNKRHPNTRP